MADVYADGVFFVDLATVHDQRLVSATLARALDLRVGATASREALIAAVRRTFFGQVTDLRWTSYKSDIGPDGAMYLLDYYRMVIEHPEWMSSDTYNSPDLYKGVEFGRIYRILPEGAPARNNSTSYELRGSPCAAVSSA